MYTSNTSVCLWARNICSDSGNVSAILSIKSPGRLCAWRSMMCFCIRQPYGGCWNSPTNQLHEAIQTHAETTFYRQSCVSHVLIFSLYFFFSWYNSRYKTCWTSGVYKYTAGRQNLAKPTQTQSPITTPNQTQTANTCFLLYYYDKDTWLILPCTNLETNQIATARTLTQLGPEYLLRKDYFQQSLPNLNLLSLCALPDLDSRSFTHLLIFFIVMPV
jgi:hypothetical protein